MGAHVFAPPKMVSEPCLDFCVFSLISKFRLIFIFQILFATRLESWVVFSIRMGSRQSRSHTAPSSTYSVIPVHLKRSLAARPSSTQLAPRQATTNLADRCAGTIANRRYALTAANPRNARNFTSTMHLRTFVKTLPELSPRRRRAFPAKKTPARIRVIIYQNTKLQVTKVVKTKSYKSCCK